MFLLSLAGALGGDASQSGPPGPRTGLMVPVESQQSDVGASVNLAGALTIVGHSKSFGPSEHIVSMRLEPAG